MLERIMSPADLKALDDGELRELAAELRERIIAIVSMNGGHLASNLGTVELTLALHAELDCPRDKLIFDVGHQAYAHKLLTGRYEAFSTIRREGGLSGFPRRGESEYDAFSVGHASTAISAALGMARARDALGDLAAMDGASEADEERLMACVERVVTQRLGDLIVTPREVDALVERMAGIVAEGINLALHPGLSAQEIAQLMAQ